MRCLFRALLVPCAALTLLVSLTFCLTPAQAQAPPQSAGWTVSYAPNGSISSPNAPSVGWGQKDPTNKFYYAWNPNGPNDYKLVSPGPTPVTSAGTFTVTFTWNGAGTPPDNIPFLVWAKASISPYPPAPSVNNGYADNSGPGLSQGWHLENKATGGARVVSFTSKPFNIQSSSGVIDGVEVSIAAYPITINLTGTTPDSSGNQNILIGQGCTAGVSGIPADLMNNTAHKPVYNWSIGGTTFQSWSPTTPANPNATPPTPANANASYYDPSSGPLTNATAHWYWNDPANKSETVTCTVTLTPPAGQGAAFNITVTKSVSVQRPSWYANETGGYMQVNTNAANRNGAICLYAGHASGQSGGGMNWTANVEPSALFTSGTLELVQLVIPNVTYVTNTGAGVPGITHSDPENDQFGLDTRYPYPWNRQGSYQPPYVPVDYATDDSPFLELNNGVASATLQDQFVDYLMFLPPDGGAGSSWVPLSTASWNTNGNATIPGTNNWADFTLWYGYDTAGTVNPTGTTPFNTTNGFPSWTRINVFPSF